MKVSQTTEIVLDGEKYLLEEGDEIEIKEGLISRAVLSVVNKFIPIDVFNQMDKTTQALFASIVADPEKREKLAKFSGDPDFMGLFT
jgi:hypothetical protein